MNKLILSVAMAFVMTAMAESAEYRNFTNQDGKTIVARVLEFDADAGKVRLELKNRKKAWVELSTLSKEDQAYILKEYQKTEENDSRDSAPRKAISEKDVKAIANLYIKAWKESDYDLWISLISPIHGTRGGSGFGFQTSHYQGVKMNLRRVDGLNAKIQIKHQDGNRTTGWLQITPAGQVKYTPLMFRHPMMTVISTYSSLYSLDYYDENDRWRDNLDRRTGACERLKNKYNIPTFRYNPKDSEASRRSSAKRIGAWLKANAPTWDVGEPKVPMPEEQFEELFKQYDR